MTREFAQRALVPTTRTGALGPVGHRRGMPLTTARRGTALAASATAVAAAVTLVVVVRIALGSARGQRWDDWSMSTVVSGRDARLALLGVLGNVSIGAIVVVAAGCVVVALSRGRVGLAFGALIVIAGANVTTQVLKHAILDRPDLGFGTLNSLPSGHTTVVASAVGAALLVAPPSLRLIVASAGGFATTLTGASTVVAGWHRPADVVAALAVSLAWTALVAAVIHGSRGAVAGVVPGVATGGAAALLLLVAVGVRPLLGWDGFIQAGLVLGAVSAAAALFVIAAAAVSPSE